MICTHTETDVCCLSSQSWTKSETISCQRKRSHSCLTSWQAETSLQDYPLVSSARSPKNTSEECGSCKLCKPCKPCKLHCFHMFGLQHRAETAFFGSTPCHSRLRPNSAGTALPCSPVTAPSHAPYRIKGSIWINLHWSNVSHNVTQIIWWLKASQDISGPGLNFSAKG